MGPRPGRRGNRSDGAAMVIDGHASMGPRPGRRGNVLIYYPSHRRKKLLQWGRVPEDAETPPTIVVYHMWHALQWGRVPEDAETRASRVGRVRSARRFNGA